MWQGSPALVVDRMVDLVLPARQGVAAETLRQAEHRMRQWILMDKAGQQVQRPPKKQGKGHQRGYG